MSYSISVDLKKIAKVDPPSQIFMKLGKMKDLLLLITENQLFQNWTRINRVMNFQKLLLSVIAQAEPN